MQEILLINPKSNKKLAQKERIEFPLKLLYFGTILKKNGFSVKILDFYLEENINLVKEVTNDVFMVVISCSTKNLLNAIEIADLCKKIKKKITVVMEGSHAMSFPYQVVSDKSFDIVLLGEGESVISELAEKCYMKKTLIDIPGILFIEKGKIIKTENSRFFNMDSLPMIDYSLIDLKKYIYRKNFMSKDRSIKKIFRFSFSRGCPFNCFFCQYKNYSYKMMSLNRIIKETKRIVELVDPDFIYFEDATFFYNKKIIIDFLDFIKENRKDFRFKIICTTRLNFFNDDYISAHFIEKYKDLIFIWDMGIEHCNERILLDVNKKINIKDIYKIIDLSKEKKVKWGFSFMVGLPGETIKDSIENMRFIENIKKQLKDVLITYQFYQPLGINVLSEKAVKLGYNRPLNLRDWENQIDTQVGTVSPVFLPWVDVDTLEYLMLFCEICINDFQRKSIKNLAAYMVLIFSWRIRNFLNFFNILKFDLFFLHLLGFKIFNRKLKKKKLEKISYKPIPLL